MFLKVAVIAAVLTASLGVTLIYGGETIKILIKEIIIPPNPGPRSVLPAYSSASIDIDAGYITVDFNRKIENISITVSHSSLGILDIVTMNYDYQTSIDIPIEIEEGTYTIAITGNNYQAIGYFDNY